MAAFQLTPTRFPGGVIARLFWFFCPGCSSAHAVPIDQNPDMPHWTYGETNGRPTLSPSLVINPGRSNPKEPLCHSFVRDGRIEFLADCSHARAGQTLDLPELPEWML